LCGAVAVMTYTISDFGKLCVEHLPGLLGDIKCVVRTDYRIILTIKVVHPKDIEIYITDDVEEDQELTVEFGGERHLHFDDWIDEEGDTPQDRQEFLMSQLEMMADAIIFEIEWNRKRSNTT
jgi:hypothetical protein